MTAIERLANFYNIEDYHRVGNPGGMANNGHRINWIPLCRDVGTVGEAALGTSTASTTRLLTVFNEDNAGPSNYRLSLSDVGTVALDMGLSSDAIIRLVTYNNSNYNSISNTFGFGLGGHRVNFIRSLSDIVEAGRAIALA